MNTDYYDEAIADQKQYEKEAKQEKDDFLELIDGIDKISIGFTKISRYLKTHVASMDRRIVGHQLRAAVLEEEKKSENK